MVSSKVASMLPCAMPTMPLASFRPSPVADTTPTTMPTVAQARATGQRALGALGEDG